MKRLSIQPEDPIVALEGLSDSFLGEFSLRTVRNRIADSIPSLVHNAKEVLSRSSLNKSTNVNYLINEKVMAKAIEELVYMKVGDVQVYVPKGFTGGFSDYLSILGSAVSLSTRIPARLTQYNQFLSLLISSPDVRSSTKEYAGTSGSDSADVDAVTNVMSTFFTDKNHTDRAKLIDTFSSSGDILNCARALKDITDSTSKTEVTDLKKLVADCTELLNALSAAAKEGRLANMSQEVMRSLGAMTLAMAKQVELVGMVHFSVDQAVNAMRANEKLVIQMARYDKK